ncbi:MAG: dipeptidase [Candidatus Roseilinea sp.]|uniref:dipeptidase n=1 Tax=Candidatus Roseilinea sp. TaxID=2838777 RepID=UPI0040495E02
MTTSIDGAIRYAQERHDLFVSQLLEYLSIPSISAQPQHNRDIKYAALWLVDHLRALGLRAEIYETGNDADPGHPIVFAEWQHTDPHRPTLLIYGHYDVQPVDPIEEWESQPFEPVIRDGYIYARGASDNKGQHMAHIKAVESLLKTAGTLPVNVKFLIEGEEEIGGPHLSAFIAGHADLLACDAVVISDSALLSPTQPALIYGLRGLVYFEVEARCAARDLHSGTYGGNVQNPLMALAQILARLKDEQGRILVPGFYDDARALDAAEREALARAPLSEAGIIAQTGASQVFGEPGFSIAERMGARPTLEINGMWGGYTGPGAKTVLPAVARAKISCRLIPYQDPDKVARAVTEYMQQIAPPATTLTFHRLQGGHRATLIARDSAYMQAAARAAEAAYGNEPVWMLEGGSIPVVNDFQSVLGKPVILLGFGLESDRLHAPNERFALACYEKGIEASIRLLHECQ